MNFVRSRTVLKNSSCYLIESGTTVTSLELMLTSCELVFIEFMKNACNVRCVNTVVGCP